MNPIYKKAVGIDVCKGFANYVCLEKSLNGITSASGKQLPLDKELLCGNTSEDFKSLGDAVKKMKLTIRLQHCDAAMCLCSWPELLQILKLPDSAPDASLKFIQDEIRQYAVLPLKNIQTDYCSLRGGGAERRVLVGASQAEPVAIVTRELEKTQVDVRLVEPAIISLIRACYKKVIKPAGQKNTMLVLLRDNNINVCVFSGQKFDFLRTRKIEDETNDSIKQTDAVIEQIESVMQFYEIEKTSEQKDWQVYLTCCPQASKTKEIIEKLKNNNSRQNIQFFALGPEHTVINIQNSANSEFSIIAAGAAMKLLDSDDSGISINMLPDEITDVRKSYNQLLIIINVAAVILSLLFLHIAHISRKTAWLKYRLGQEQMNQEPIDISNLVRMQEDANGQAQKTLGNINALDTAFKDKIWHNWSYILAEVAAKAPNSVQISNLQSRNSSTIAVEGIAINYAAINEFINKLSGCKTISSASLADTKQNTQYGNGVLDYSIVCSLASGKIKEN